MSADLPGMPGPHDPALDHLFGALTADGSADELAGKDAALTMFRDNRRRPRHSLRFASPVRMAAAAAAAAVIVGGIAAAAYGAALPAPVQHIAYRLLDRIGVPDTHRLSPSSSAHHAAAPTPSAAPASAGTPCPCRPGKPGAGTAQSLVLTAAHAQIPAYGDDVFSGLLAPGGQPEPGVRVRLLEHVDGRQGWHLAGIAMTDRDGDVTLAVRHLTGNASFRLAAPDGTVSRAVLITVTPPVSLHLAPGRQPGTAILTARALFADRGDTVVLQALSGTVWYRLGEKLLDRNHLASFTVNIPRSGERDYRVVIQGTLTHGASVSGQERVSAHLSRHGRYAHGFGQPADLAEARVSRSRRCRADGRPAGRQARPAASPAAMRG